MMRRPLLGAPTDSIGYAQPGPSRNASQHCNQCGNRNERAVHRAAVLLDVAEVPVPAVAVRNINTVADLLAGNDPTNI